MEQAPRGNGRGRYNDILNSAQIIRTTGRAMGQTQASGTS